MNKRVIAPSTMSAKEKRAFRALIANLVAQGVDPVQRADLAADYIRLEARIEQLRIKEQAEPTNAMAVTRALNTATTERRRLHSSLFAGGQQVEPDQVMQSRPAVITRAEADLAWFRHFHDPSSTETEEQLKARYGEPSWAALLATKQDELAGLRA